MMTENPETAPARIVCLSAEAVEILFLIGCGERIIGATAFAMEPLAARAIPRVGGFAEVNYEKIDALKPDLVITFSDVQAEVASELVRRGHTVLATNQRSLAQIFQTILLIGRVVKCEGAAEKLVSEMRTEIHAEDEPKASGSQPAVYFEEWDDPMISGIRWVGELIDAAGGRDIFPELRDKPRAKDRTVTSVDVVSRQPDIIVASWCGKSVDVEKLCQRPGWADVSAVRSGRVHEIKSGDILQPGPGIMRGFRQLRQIIRASLA
jgi:iron complex transport system substrate-binding protein